MIDFKLKDKVPKLMKDDATADAMLAKADTHIVDWIADIKSIQNINTIEETRSEHLSELGFLLAAGINPGDSDKVQRTKILNAIATHKKRVLWLDDIKIRIDALTGLNSDIVTELIEDPYDWIWYDHGTDSPPNGIWGDDTDSMLWGGSGSLATIPGHVFIDFGGTVSDPTAATIAKVIEELDIDGSPAYFRISFVYDSGGGVYVVYPNGVIG